MHVGSGRPLLITYLMNQIVHLADLWLVGCAVRTDPCSMVRTAHPTEPPRPRSHHHRAPNGQSGMNISASPIWDIIYGLWDSKNKSR